MVVSMYAIPAVIAAVTTTTAKNRFRLNRAPPVVSSFAMSLSSWHCARLIAAHFFIRHIDLIRPADPTHLLRRPRGRMPHSFVAMHAGDRILLAPAGRLHRRDVMH